MILNREVLLLLLVWFAFWGAYNLVFLKRKLSTEKSNFVTILFLSLAIIISQTTRMMSGHSLILMFILFAIILCCSILFQSISSRRLSNSIFQMIWLYAIYLSTDSYWITVLIFSTTHVPIVLVKHLGLFPKMLIVCASTFGSMLITYFLSSFAYPINIVVAVALHYWFYYLLRPIDVKNKWGIIN